jgi:hypothetical protein
MSTVRFSVIALLVLMLCPGPPLPAASASESGRAVAPPATAEVLAEIRRSVEGARQRFEVRDANGVLAYISERYRSDGLTKRDVGQQLLALFGLYDQLRARVAVDQARMADGGVWVYTSGEVSGHLPFVGWVAVFSWQNQPEVARREGSAWRLFGFQN